MLRHSTAHLLAEAVRRLYPGVKIAIGPPIENGFYYDFEFPEPIHEDDLERIEAEIERELPRAASGRARRSRATRRRRALRGRGRAVQGRARRHRRGRHLALHAGRLHRPLPRPAPPELEADQGVKLTGLAGAYWRGDASEHAADPHLRHRVLHPRPTSTRTSSGSRRRRRATTAGSAPSSTSSTLDDISPGSPFWHPKGMVIWNELEDAAPAREREARLRRGADAAHLRQGALGDLRPLGEVPRATCS